MLWMSEFEFDAGWRVPSHTHRNEHELLIVTAGRMGLRMPDGKLQEERGTVLNLPQDYAHEVWTLGAGPLRMCCIWWEAPVAPAKKIARQDAASFQRIETGIQWLKELSTRRDAGWSSAADGLLRAILHECGFAEPLDLHAQNRIERAQTFVREHLAERLTLEAMAGAAQMSRSHFAHEFKKVAGCSPMQYLRDTRVKAASRLLASSAMPIKAIASATGFRDAFELSRVVKRVAGRAPREIRRAPREDKIVNEPH